MGQIRVGFLGAGGMGQHHLKAVAQMPEVRVVAVCDISATLAEAAARRYEAHPYQDHHDMLEKEDLDALYVAIPPFAHSDAELIAAKKGIHLFVEKPVALTLEKAREVRAAIQRSGIISAVGYVLRYYQAPTLMRHFLADKAVAMIVVTRWGGVPGTPWWGVMSRSGGQLVEQTTHQVDLVRYITGKEITSVYADYALRVMSGRENWDIPDVYSLAMKLEDGTPVSLTTACTMYRGGGQSTINFLLDGYLVEMQLTKISTSPEANSDLDGEYGEEIDIDRAFIDAVRLNDRALIRSTYADAVKTLAVTLAANESARSGRPVKVPLD
ncbi:MAG: Gfo/Idh/MocA family protein [Anaerolineae bacterium]